MRIAIASLDAVPATIAEWKPTALVSVYSPSSPDPLPAWDGPRLALPFSDIEDVRPSRPSRHAIQHRRATPFTADHLEAFLDFILHHRQGRILIHCVAGLGRSPALAIVALATVGGLKPHYAGLMVARAAPHASPNRLVLRHAEAAIEGMPIAGPCERLFPYARSARGAEGPRLGWREVEDPLSPDMRWGHGVGAGLSSAVEDGHHPPAGGGGGGVSRVLPKGAQVPQFASARACLLGNTFSGSAPPGNAPPGAEIAVDGPHLPRARASLSGPLMSSPLSGPHPADHGDPSPEIGPHLGDGVRTSDGGGADHAASACRGGGAS